MTICFVCIWRSVCLFWTGHEGVVVLFDLRRVQYWLMGWKGFGFLTYMYIKQINVLEILAGIKFGGWAPNHHCSGSTVFSPGPFSIAPPHAFNSLVSLMWLPKWLMWSQIPPKPHPPTRPWIYPGRTLSSIGEFKLDGLVWDRYTMSRPCLWQYEYLRNWRNLKVELTCPTTIIYIPRVLFR